MYNYPAPGQYGRPAGFPAFAPPGAPQGLPVPPGMGMAPPGVAAPGTVLQGLVPPGMMPPGIQQLQAKQPSRPAGLGSAMQAPPSMPNIDFNAPVIRLGTAASARPANSGSDATGSRKESTGDYSAGGHRRGLGHGSDFRNDAQRQQMRDTMLALQPPSKEEIARTIYVAAFPDSLSDEEIDKIFRSAGNLRRWLRATDADNKSGAFGFAEYEDAESLGTAANIFKDLRVPLSSKVQQPDDGTNGELKTAKLEVIVDENSHKYVEEWRTRRGDDNPAAIQFRDDMARESLTAVLAELALPKSTPTANEATDTSDTGAKLDGTAPEVVTIPLSAEDELSDIPAEMRETVAAEIAAFRDRSIRRDLERLKREEEMEQAELNRSSDSARADRLASPPPSVSLGSGNANSAPLGPRDRGIQGAPVGPKGYSGGQLPRDYQKGVSFVNGTTNGMYDGEDSSDASDEELECRRREKKQRDLDKLYLDQERRWLNRERSKTAAMEREKGRDKEEDSRREKEQAAMAKGLKEWNDDVEASRRTEEYYQDRSLWLRNRAAFRSREAEADDRDRATEEREKAREVERVERSRRPSDSIASRRPDGVDVRSETPKEPQRFKLSLGAAAQKAQAAAPRRTVAEVEGLLEDEEEVESTAKRTLVPIKFDSAADAKGYTEEERAQIVRQLASDIPSDKDGLWNWTVQWDFLDESVIGDQLKPFVEKKIMEYLGVQEQMLVDVVEEQIRKKGSPQDLVTELEGALDEEAEVLVKKLWRMIIFFSESEKRGLSA